MPAVCQPPCAHSSKPDCCPQDSKGGDEVYSGPTGRKGHWASSRPKRLLFACNVLSASPCALILSPPQHSNRSRRKSPGHWPHKSTHFSMFSLATWEKLKDRKEGEEMQREASWPPRALCRFGFQWLFSSCLTLQWAPCSLVLRSLVLRSGLLTEPLSGWSQVFSTQCSESAVTKSSMHRALSSWIISLIPVLRTGMLCCSGSGWD